MTFIQAVTALTGDSIKIEYTAEKCEKPFNLHKLKLHMNSDKARQYLKKYRSIGYSIMFYLTENRLLYQEQGNNNAVFLIYDEHNNCVGAEIQGITPKRFKGIKAGSKYGYGFNVRFSNDNTFDYALFFESAIDLISFIDYKLNHEKKSLNRCILISMAGLKGNIVKHTLKAFQGELKIVLCIDNDNAGQAFIKEIEVAKIDYIDKRPDEKYKDWNEQLIDTKRNLKPISRLINHSSASNRGLAEQIQNIIEKERL